MSENLTSDASNLSPLKKAFLALEQTRAKLRDFEQRQAGPVAIIGIGCRFPGGANSPEAYWQLLLAGRDAVTEVPRDRWDIDAYYDEDVEAAGKMNARRAAFIDDHDKFDAELFSISPREAAGMDPQQRLFLEVAWQALEQAAQAPDRLGESATGVFAGIATSDYAHMQFQRNDPAMFDPHYTSGIAHSIVSGRLSYLLGLQGPSISVDTACSSSLVAVHLACQSLRAGECGMALAGGVNVMLTPEMTVALSKSRMLAPDGRSKTFDADADGFTRGEGCGVVVLKRLSDAQRDGDRIIAVIRGSAVNQDGPSSSLTAPNGPAQEAVIRQALNNARMNPGDIQFIEAHGTGTQLGDPIEVNALGAVFGPGRAVDQPLVIGSVKTNMGHLEAAAGIAGLIKTALSIHNGYIPSHLHFQRHNPHINWQAAPFVVPQDGMPWPPAESRAAGVTSIGFSGTNAHVILASADDAQAPVPSLPERTAHALNLSARSDDQLKELARRHSAELSMCENFADYCHTANIGRAHLEHRLSLTADNATEAVDLLHAWLDENEDIVVASGRIAEEQPKVAFVFTGQGAQYSGMGKGLYETEPLVRKTLDQCQEILRPLLEHPLLEVMFDPDKADLLNDTRYAQPAMFALEYALAELWKSLGVTPIAALGHSLGEMSASCVAGVFSLEEGLALVAERARLMQSMSPGAMAAVFASQADVTEILASSGVQFDFAALNGPAEVVISGAASAIEEVQRVLESREIRVQPLVVSHAFHSQMMEPMLEAYERAASRINYATPQIRVVSNVTGDFAKGDELRCAAYWRSHVRRPVCFERSIRRLIDFGCNAFVEIGPKPTLINMARRGLESSEALWLPTIRAEQDAWRIFLGSLGQLYVAGQDIEWNGLDKEHVRRKVVIPTYPFERRRHWLPELDKKGRPSCRVSKGHAMIGEPMASPLPQKQFDLNLTEGPARFLLDHRVGDSAILPATGIIEIALAAAERLMGPASLEELEIPSALTIEEETQGQLVVWPEEDGSRRWELHSGIEDRWNCRAQGVLKRLPSDASIAAPNAITQPARTISAEAFYDAMDLRPTNFGPAFRGVTLVEVGECCAVGQITAPQSIAHELQHFIFHPALLDACLQPLASFIGEDDALFMPIGAEKIIVLSKPGNSVRSHLSLRPRRHEDLVEVDVTVTSDDGTVLARVEGLRLKRAQMEEHQAWRDWLYETTWEEQPLSLPSASPVDLDAIAASVATSVPKLIDEWALDELNESMPVLDRLCRAYIAQALAAVSESGVAPSYRRLWERYRRIIDQQSSRDSIADLLQDLRKNHPSVEHELALVQQCGGHLANVLTGRQDPVGLLFPGGSNELATRLYTEARTARVMNSMAENAVREWSSRIAPYRAIHALEVGGGSGATTAAVLQALPSERSNYVFTDISPTFVARAKEKFDGRAGFEARVWDLEKGAQALGTQQKFELIVAANVVHATSSLDATLDQLRELLVPGGLLLMVEVTTDQLWVDVTFGLTDGWWCFTDTNLRQSSPLLNQQQWMRLLQDRKFDNVIALPDTDHEALGAHSLILAEKPAQQEAPQQWLICGTESSSLPMAAALEQAGHAVALAGVDEAASRVAAFSDLSCVVFAPGAAELDQAPQLLHALMDTVQTMIRRWSRPPRLVLLTERARSLDDSEQPSPALAPLWGFMSSVTLEHPELRIKCIDANSSTPANAILEEIRSSDDEQRVLWRAERRYVQRVDRLKIAPQASPANEPAHLISRRRGDLGELAYEPCDPRSPGSGQILIRNLATGLNFRDVLNALDVYAGGQVPFGGECAGQVIAVGDGVVGFKVGDRVATIVEDGFASEVVAPAALSRTIPDSMSLEQAATFPIAFVTAAWSLMSLGQLRPGESVLIHAAAGGVGMAAIQLAQRIGAQVFATAGSDEKRRYLRGLGVQHVYDSRSTSFAKALMRETNDRGVDLVLNSLTGEMLQASLQVLAQGGRFIELGRAEILTPEQVGSLKPGVQYHPVDLTSAMRDEPQSLASLWQQLWQWAEDGSLQPLPIKNFEHEQTIDAFRFMAQARHIGKIAIRHPLPLADVSIRADATYLITGGAGGLGLLTAKWLVDQGARHIALLGRSAATDSAAEFIEALRQQAADVRFIRCDVGNRTDMQEAFEQIAKSMPALAGVFHLAGTLEDSALVQMDWTKMEKVLSPKVNGALLLHELTSGVALDFFVIYSSVASVFGAPGQANHAAANAFLDAFARWRNLQGARSLSINWGAWSELGAGVKNAGHAAARGLLSMAPQHALNAMHSLLRHSKPQAMIASIDWSVLEMAMYGRRTALLRNVSQPETSTANVATQPKAADDWLKQLSALPENKRLTNLTGMVQREVARILGLKQGSQIDPIRPLQELGLDSLMAVELRNVLGKALNTSLPATLLFDYPSLKAVSGFLAQKLEIAPASAESSSVTAQGNVDPLAKMEQLSDEEIDRLFSQSLGKGS